MFGFLSRKRPSFTAPVRRSFLRVEELGVRAVPTDGLSDITAPPPPPPGGGLENPPPATPPVTPPQVAPIIDTFTAAEVAHGWYKFSGHVTATNPAGLIVKFDGTPCLEGRTTTVDANGNFTMTIQVATDGSDIGTISAQTSQNGVLSNLALSYMSPTP